VSNKIDTFSVLFVKRNAAKRGPTSSDAWNDTIEELSHDLTELNSQWNNRLVPLLSTLPNGEEGNVVNSIDAWADGLSGTTLFVDATATNSSHASYYNSIANRPNTILEQLDNIYSDITALQADLEAQIVASTPTAIQISIADSGALYVAANVETALAEVMTKANLALSLESEQATTLTPVGTTQTIDFTTGKFQTVDLESASGNVTLTLSNALAGHTYTIRVIQDSVSPLDIIWPTSVKWAGGSAPVISVGSDAVDIVTLRYASSVYYASVEQNLF